MANMLVIWKTPPEPADFDKHYFEVHIPLAKKLPGIRKYEVSHGPVTTLYGDEAYLVAILTFDSVAAIKAAFASEAGAACAADRRQFSPDPGQCQMLLCDTQEV